MIFKCKMCGDNIGITEGKTHAKCDSCGSEMSIPNTNDERKLNLFSRADHFRRGNEFDRAIEAFEKILDEDNKDAEAHWGLLLSRYGIEYVVDPSTQSRVPTCHRMQASNILEDMDYLQAIENTIDLYTQDIYKKEAQAILEIQKKILAIASNEEPYDIFICYKETDESNKRTQDSVLAQDIYHNLTNEGYKVFFARITLESMLGKEYEPYIFSALNSSKVMLAIGTKAEYFNATWVKNEWSRFLQLAKTDKSKIIIPCYRDMDAYDIPDALSMYQSQDMAKIGFIQDLNHGIKKVLVKEEENTTIINNTQIVEVNNAQVEPLLKRIDIFLSDKEFDKVEEYANRILDIEPENCKAYISLFLCEYKYTSLKFMMNHHKSLKLKEIVTYYENIKKNTYFNKALKYSVDNEKRELQVFQYDIKYDTIVLDKDYTWQNKFNKIEKLSNIHEYKDSESIADKYKEELYVLASELYSYELIDVTYNSYIVFKNQYNRSNTIFKNLCIYNYKDSEKLIDHAKAYFLEQSYKMIEELISNKCYKELILILEDLINDNYNYKEIQSLYIEYKEINSEDIKLNKYNDAINFMNRKRYCKAVKIFKDIENYKDSQSYYSRCLKKIKLRRIITTFTIVIISITTLFTTIVYNNYLSNKNDYYIKKQMENYLINRDDFIESRYQLLDSWGYSDSLEDVIYMNTYDYMLIKPNGNIETHALDSSGDVTLFDSNDIPSNVVSVTDTYYSALFLIDDGSLVEVKNLNYTSSTITEAVTWKNIKQLIVSNGGSEIAAIHFDGTVSVTSSELNVSAWTDIVEIAHGKNFLIGLKEDGTVVSTGTNDKGQCDVSDWADIISISAGYRHTLGIKSDGTVVSTGYNEYSQCDVSNNFDVVMAVAGQQSTALLTLDGNVKVYGNNTNNIYEAEEWSDIISIYLVNNTIVGITSNGIVLTTNEEYFSLK